MIATRGPTGAPQAALVGIAATDRAEIVFDTVTGSRKYANIQCDPEVALVIGGWHDEVTVQCEGRADILSGSERERCQRFYFEQYPDGRDRASWPDIAYIRVTPRWVRKSDYRPDTFGVEESTLTRSLSG